jgi:hypothetical protein
MYGVPDVGGMDYLCMVYQMLGFEDELGLLVYGVPDVGGMDYLCMVYQM